MTHAKLVRPKNTSNVKEGTQSHTSHGCLCWRGGCIRVKLSHTSLTGGEFNWRYFLGVLKLESRNLNLERESVTSGTILNGVSVEFTARMSTRILGGAPWIELTRFVVSMFRVKLKGGSADSENAIVWAINMFTGSQAGPPLKKSRRALGFKKTNKLWHVEFCLEGDPVERSCARQERSSWHLLAQSHLSLPPSSFQRQPRHLFARLFNFRTKNSDARFSFARRTLTILTGTKSSALGHYASRSLSTAKIPQRR